jgi:hypothetical protein
VDQDSEYSNLKIFSQLHMLMPKLDFRVLSVSAAPQHADLQGMGAWTYEPATQNAPAYPSLDPGQSWLQELHHEYSGSPLEHLHHDHSPMIHLWHGQRSHEEPWNSLGYCENINDTGELVQTKSGEKAKESKKPAQGTKRDCR